MIDLSLLREFSEQTIAQLKKKDPSYDGQLLFNLDKSLRQIKTEVEYLRHEKNALAKLGREGITPQIREKSIELGKQLKDKENELQEVQEAFNTQFLACPNIPMQDVPEGNKEANVVVREYGKKPEFDFLIKNHVELGTNLGWFDFEAAARIAGANFALYKGDAVKLMYALSMFMLKHNSAHGYDPILPSVLVNERSLEVSGNFPKFKDEVYQVTQDKLFLTPTAEVNLANMYRDHIFTDPKELPIRLTAWTSCFRREAGTYGATERGLIRIHQFEKVELYTICEPQKSADELDRMIACAEEILKKLDLHYRVSLLAAQDTSFQSAKTFDIEVWLPGQKEYYEVSSASNCTDFQSRRGLMRYKRPDQTRTELVHTLNGSSLALPRLMVAIMEVYQQVDGTICIPDVLQKEALFS